MVRRSVAVGLVWGSLLGCSMAQGTKLWSVGRYDEMQRGTADGVAIRSDGRLEAGPATSLLFTAGSSYVWSVAVDAAGAAYVGLGGSTNGSAAVMRVTPDGKSEKVFAGTELGVQRFVWGRMGRCMRRRLRMGKCTGFARRALRRRWCSIRARRRRSRDTCGIWRWAKTTRYMWLRGLLRWCTG